MKPEAIAKALTTKKMNQLAGTRRALPGQDPDREASLRAELTASFEPVGAVEMLWVSDIAYCTATMDVYRAQIYGMRFRQAEEAYSRMVEAEKLDEMGGITPTIDWSEDDRNFLAIVVDRKFAAPWHKSFLDDSRFASLLARAGKHDLEMLRMLQQLLHDEAKERDRIINQFERRRRNAMRDAIELAEERRREAIFRQLSARDNEADETIEDATFELIACDNANAALEDSGRDLADDANQPILAAVMDGAE